MVMRHEDETNQRRHRRASVVGGAQGNWGRGATGGVQWKPWWAKCRKEAADRVARHPADY